MSDVGKVIYVSNLERVFLGKSTGWEVVEDSDVISGAGYTAGGYSSTRVSTIDKLTFTNDNCSSITSGLSSVRAYAAGIQTYVNFEPVIICNQTLNLLDRVKDNIPFVKLGNPYPVREEAIPKYKIFRDEFKQIVEKSKTQFIKYPT